MRDTLVDLETQIARRADEIAATVASRTPLNLYRWLQAEQEVLARLNVLDRSMRMPEHGSLARGS